MVLQSTRWLALGYFTYFFSYGIFLPFWSVWLKGIGLTPETIGLLLGAGLVAAAGHGRRGTGTRNR
ncbi:MFS transporter, partial [Pseudomonas aeruginosa]|uniref:MFS transporter n=1 Tax=Pseudomonas aeruginosa TaxID=287 RepID=UPI0031B70CDE